MKFKWVTMREEPYNNTLGENVPGGIVIRETLLDEVGQPATSSMVFVPGVWVHPDGEMTELDE